MVAGRAVDSGRLIAWLAGRYEILGGELRAAGSTALLGGRAPWAAPRRDRRGALRNAGACGVGSVPAGVLPPRSRVQAAPAGGAMHCPLGHVHGLQSARARLGKHAACAPRWLCTAWRSDRTSTCPLLLEHGSRSRSSWASGRTHRRRLGRGWRRHGPAGRGVRGHTPREQQQWRRREPRLTWRLERRRREQQQWRWLWRRSRMTARAGRR